MPAVRARRNVRSGPGAATWVAVAIVLVVVGLGAYLLLGGQIVNPFGDGVITLSGDKERVRPRVPEGRVAVPMSARAIPAYRKVTRDDLWNKATGRLAVVYLDRDHLPEGVVLEFNEVVGRVLAARKEQGYVFTEDDFLPEGTRPGLVAGIPLGKRAVRVDADTVSGLVGLHPGDRFDLVSAIAIDPQTAAGSLGDLPGVFGPRMASEAAARSLSKQARVRVLVQSGQVVSPVETRNVPVASRSITQGLVTKTRPVQEVVIAIDPAEVAPLLEALAVEARIQCVPRSGQPGDPVDSVTPELEPRSLFGDRDPAGRGGYRFVDTIKGDRREILPVPAATSGSEGNTGDE